MGLEAVEFIIRVEETFGIEIEDSEAEKLRTIGDLEGLIILKLEFEKRLSSGVYEKIIDLLFTEFNRKPSRLNRQTRFIDDLEFG